MHNSAVGWHLEHNTIQMVCRSVQRRRWECTVSEGGHFEHVRA